MNTETTYTNGEVELVLRVPFKEYGKWSYLVGIWDNFIRHFDFIRKQ